MNKEISQSLLRGYSKTKAHSDKLDHIDPMIGFQIGSLNEKKRLFKLE